MSVGQIQPTATSLSYLIRPNLWKAGTPAPTGGISRASFLSSGSGMSSLQSWPSGFFRRGMYFQSLVPKDFTRSSEPPVLTIFQASWTFQAQEDGEVLYSLPMWLPAG